MPLREGSDAPSPMFPASPDVDDARGRRKCQGRCGCREEERCRVLQWRKAAGQVERLERVVQGDYVESINVNWERAEDRQLLRHCAKITRSQSSTSSTICWERAESQSFFSLGAPVSMEPGNLQRLCGTPGARSGQATSIQGFLPELGRFQVRGRGRVLDGVRWRK